MRYDEGANIVPDVADRWAISSDGRRYTFHLREDVEWSDGRPVTAHDFVTTYRRALGPATGADLAPALLSPVVGARDVRDGRAPAERAGIHAVDDHTLVIELAEPTSYFMYTLAHGALVPVPPHLVEVHGRDWCRPETIVSNGPFLLAEWEPGSRLLLERNSRYHPRPSLALPDTAGNSLAFGERLAALRWNRRRPNAAYRHTPPHTINPANEPGRSVPPQTKGAERRPDHMVQLGRPPGPASNLRAASTARPTVSGSH